MFLVLVFGDTNFRIPECLLGIFTQLGKQSQTKLDSKLIRVTVPAAKFVFKSLCLKLLKFNEKHFISLLFLEA